MKCEILCKPCAARMEKLLGDGSRYPGEHIKYVSGTAKPNPMIDGGVSICDWCSKDLPEGTDVVATTIWAEHSPNPYREWEGEFITISEDQP